MKQEFSFGNVNNMNELANEKKFVIEKKKGKERTRRMRKKCKINKIIKEKIRRKNY